MRSKSSFVAAGICSFLWLCAHAAVIADTAPVAAVAAPAGTTPLSPELLQRLPERYRDAAHRYAALPSEFLKSLTANKTLTANAKDEVLLENVFIYISDSPEGTRFLLQSLQLEPDPAIRLKLLSAVKRAARRDPAIDIALAAYARTETNIDNYLETLDALEYVQGRRASSMLRQRVHEASARGDAQAQARLEEKLDYYEFRHINLPRFAYRPPPVFAAALANDKKNAETLRIAVFGDFGSGKEEQFQTAAAMRALDEKEPFDLGVTVGDNFYPSGLDDPDHERWQTQWANLYDPIGVTFYPSFGNHDYKAPDSPAAELAYSNKSKTWKFPAPYYTYTAGPVQFFALDTERLTSVQLRWLETELDRSQATWKIVYGHHPIYSPGRHGDGGLMIEKLLPLLRGKAHAYLAGHDHILGHVKPEEGVEFFISGGGGTHSYEIAKNYPRMLFGQSVHGFLVLDVTSQELRFRFIDPQGKELYAYTRKAAVPTALH